MHWDVGCRNVRLLLSKVTLIYVSCITLCSVVEVRIHAKENVLFMSLCQKDLTSLEELDVTNHKCLSVIPTQQQVCDAIADIIQHKEKAPNEYAYIEFPLACWIILG